MGLQSCRSPNFGNFKTPNLGVPRKNDIWVQALWLDIKNIIRGKVVVSPSLGCGESCESVFACDLFVHQKCTNYILTNLLFGLCKCVWIIDSLVIHSSPHPEILGHPPTPEVLWTRGHTTTHYPFVVFTFGFTVESIKEFWGCINQPIGEIFLKLLDQIKI